MHRLQLTSNVLWTSLTGELVSFTIFGKVHIVVNSLRAAKELLEARSAIYSNRPHMTVLDMSGWDFNLGLMPYGNGWRARRRLLHLEFATDRASAYWPLQMEKSEEMVLKLDEDPDGLLDHIRVSAASIAMEIAYGLDIAPKNDPFVELAQKSVAMIPQAGRPGVALFNALPFPSWIIKNKDLNPREEAERAAKDASGVLYAAGADTTTATLTSIVLALVLNPEVQIKAQAEIDRVVGRNRLPTFDDRPQLPYVEAVVREVRRWSQATPLSIVREIDQDDIYMGMLIPKEPDAFRPERFLTNEGSLNNDRSWTLFGFGRRVCAGQHLADATIWIVAASILAVYTISKAKDAQGNEIPVEVATLDGLVCHPAPFRHSIKPRDAEAEALVKSLRKNRVY
ncbi:hypothetical protein EWM64_g6251 [Hericium alpestre]|uniref:Cytochrome P450 n=1 Tax=Hericium alpestre TaxID=135208 RepID=A0A4Y9ZSA5_9AGAM|nr:hypothetical protein EWM64_g6251 [Hericium alpestre]